MTLMERHDYILNWLQPALQEIHAAREQAVVDNKYVAAIYYKNIGDALGYVLRLAQTPPPTETAASTPADLSHLSAVQASIEAYKHTPTEQFL